MDEITATRMIVEHYLAQDVALLKLLGRVLQALHNDQSPSHRALELDIMAQQADIYESLGRFDEADQVQRDRVEVAHQHLIASGGQVINEVDDSLSEGDDIVYAPCQPIGCDNGYHRPGCWYALADDSIESDARVFLANATQKEHP